MAGKRFSELNAATEADNADLLAAAQDKGGGVLETRKLTLAQILAWLRESNDPRYAQLSEYAHFLNGLEVDGAVSLAGDLDVDGAVALLQMPTVGGDDIVSQGTTGSGSWAQRADGVMYQWHQFALSLLDIPSAAGTYASSAQEWNYPKLFFDSNIAMGGLVRRSGAYSWVADGRTAVPDKDKMTYYVIASQSSSPADAYVRLFAIGRWK